MRNTTKAFSIIDSYGFNVEVFATRPTRRQLEDCEAAMGEDCSIVEIDAEIEKDGRIIPRFLRQPQ